MEEKSIKTERTDHAKESPSPIEFKNSPWDAIMASHDSFLSDLECIGEMVSLVLPILKQKDLERDSRMNALKKEIQTEKGKGLDRNSALALYTDITELLGHIKKDKKADQMFRQGIITSVVSKFDKFIITVLQTSYLQNPNWLKNPDKNISYKQLLEIESLELLKKDIIAKEIDMLMRDSHHVQISFLDGKLKLGIEKEFPSWLEFLEITERRNLFVHTGGTVSPIYMDNCKEWKIPIDTQIKEGDHLSANDKYIQKAIDCFYELSVRVAQASIRRMFPESFENADNRLNNSSVKLLVDERWELAERIFKFALSIPEKFLAQGDVKYYFLLNSCIAKKFSGKAFNEELHSINWSPFHPKYHFAVAILEDRFDEAEKLMRSQAVQDKIPEQSFKEWPLLKEFRKTDAFLSAYKDIFKKNYSEELLVDVKREIQAQQSAAQDAPSGAGDF